MQSRLIGRLVRKRLIHARHDKEAPMCVNAIDRIEWRVGDHLCIHVADVVPRIRTVTAAVRDQRERRLSGRKSRAVPHRIGRAMWAPVFFDVRPRINWSASCDILATRLAVALLPLNRRVSAESYKRWPHHQHYGAVWNNYLLGKGATWPE